MNDSAETHAAAARRRALVIDPDGECRAFAAEALHSFRPGYDVATARNLDEAGCWLETFRPDLVVFGMDEPSAAIETLAERLGTGATGAPPRVVLCVGDPAAQTDATSLSRLGAGEVLPRPMDLGTLLGAVRRLT